MRTPLSKAVRYYETIRYLRPKQLWWRSRLRFQRAVAAKLPYSERLAHRIAATAYPQLKERIPAPFQLPGNWTGFVLQRHMTIAEAARAREFQFLNRTVRFEQGVDWQCPAESHLWRFNLHYQACLVSLGIVHSALGYPWAYSTFRELVADWVTKNRFGRGDGWHPYTASLRVVNWILAATLFENETRRDAAFHETLVVSTIQQLHFISRNLELGNGGNHLLENIKALCVGGAYFTGGMADSWLKRGITLLKREIPTQILPDGGHYERSPMYHAIVLEDLITIAVALENAGIGSPPELQTAIQNMLSFHDGLLHPDGELALFNDSALGIAPDAQSISALGRTVLGKPLQAKASIDARHALLLPAGDRSRTAAVSTGNGRRRIAYRDTGYYVFRNGKTAWIIDAGQTCPDDLPGHAHADIFSYELSIGGQRWVVDTGVKEYAQGEWRDFARSTMAHNTVSVDGTNQVDVWSSFRVGRRVRPSNVTCTLDDNGLAVLAGTHTGFGATRPHSRLFVDVEDETWLVIDEISGAGQARIESYIHFHPEVTVEPTSGGAVLLRDGRSVLLSALGYSAMHYVSGEHHPLQGWYLPEFGVAEPRTTAVFSSDRLSLTTAYLLTVRPDVKLLELESRGSARHCTVKLGGSSLRVSWDMRTLAPTVEMYAV